MPGKRPILSILRTSRLIRSTRFHLTVAGPAVALVAALAGVAATTGVVGPAGATAAPVRVVRAATIKMPESAGARRSTALAELDAILAKVAHAAHRGQSRPARPTPRQIARRMLARFGWSKRQFRYLNLLWSAESGWNVHAANPYSGAYGIPQAVPADKMASAGPKWWSNARTQVRWGLRYIKERYGSPEAAWEHELSTGWY